jgi:CBS-domain-containing membrane protein
VAALSGPMAAPALAVVTAGAAVVSAGFAVVTAAAVVTAVVVFLLLLHAPAMRARATMPSTGTKRFVRITQSLLENVWVGSNVRRLHVGYLDAR